MEEKTVDIAREFQRYRHKYNLVEKIPFDDEENKRFKQVLTDGGSLPEGVAEYRKVSTGEPVGKFYFLKKAGLSEAEIMEYLTYKKLDMLRTMKNCIVFFTVLAAANLLLSFFAGLFV